MNGDQATGCHQNLGHQGKNFRVNRYFTQRAPGGHTITLVFLCLGFTMKVQLQIVTYQKQVSGLNTAELCLVNLCLP